MLIHMFGLWIAWNILIKCGMTDSLYWSIVWVALFPFSWNIRILRNLEAPDASLTEEKALYLMKGTSSDTNI